MAREDGYSTRKREEILRFFSENPDREVGVNEIYEYLIERSARANVSTIYRYLDRLVEQGIVFKTVHGRKEQATYQYMNGRKECFHHLHLKCSKCGKIQHLDCGFMKEIQAHVGMEHGFVIDCQNSFLTGLCSDCRDSNKLAMNYIIRECNCNESMD